MFDEFQYRSWTEIIEELDEEFGEPLDEDILDYA